MSEHARQQIRHSSLYLLLVAINYGVPLLTLPIFTRVLSPEDYGLMALSAMFGVFISSLVNFGLLPVYQRNFFEYKVEKSGALLFTLLGFVSVLFCVVFSLSWVFADLLSGIIFKNSFYGGLLLLQAVAFFFNGINQYFMCYLQNAKQARRFGGYTMMPLFISTGLSLLFVCFWHTGVWGMVAATVIAEAATCAVLTYKIMRAIGFGIDLGILVKSLKLALPLTFNMFTKVFMRHFDKYLINALNSLGQTGIYNIAEKISQISFSLMTALDQVYIPTTYNKMFELKEAGGRVIGPYLTPFFYVSMLLCLLVALFSKEMLTVLTPPAYHGGANIVVVLTMYYALLFFTKQQQLLFAKKTYLLSVLFVFNALFNIVLNILLIPILGAMGAAVAAFISGLFLVTFHFYISQKAYLIEWEYRKITPVLLFLLIAAIMVLFINAQLSLGLGLCIKIMIVIGFLWLGQVIGVVTKETCQAVWQSLTRKLIADKAMPT